MKASTIASGSTFHQDQSGRCFSRLRSLAGNDSGRPSFPIFFLLGGPERPPPRDSFVYLETTDRCFPPKSPPRSGRSLFPSERAVSQGSPIARRTTGRGLRGLDGGGCSVRPRLVVRRREAVGTRGGRRECLLGGAQMQTLRLFIAHSTGLGAGWGSWVPLATKHALENHPSPPTTALRPPRGPNRPGPARMRPSSPIGERPQGRQRRQ